MNGTRTTLEQGQYQFMALLTTLLISLSGGYITGHIINCKCLKNKKSYFNDDDNWDLEEEEELINP